jgi:hypothetical protein
MENHHFLIGKPSITGPFSIAFCMFTREYLTFQDGARGGRKTPAHHARLRQDSSRTIGKTQDALQDRHSTVDGPAKSESPVEDGGKNPMIFRASSILCKISSIHMMKWSCFSRENPVCRVDIPVDIQGAPQNLPSVCYYSSIGVTSGFQYFTWIHLDATENNMNPTSIGFNHHFTHYPPVNQHNYGKNYILLY